MNILTKTLIGTQAVTLAGLGFALWAAYGPVTEDEMRRSLFYMNGRQSAIVMGLDDLPVKDYTTCTEAVEHYSKTAYKGPEWSKPKEDHDKEAFLLGCKEQLLENYDKKN
ncbi:hypothetical protein [Nonomuraea candida]|uniref:hypothetical protein n=1 Tax=Nonomuraea candida TaxID=359159 RepID=UPI000AB1511F|nr:hypothetical protein [Nonomuraea candida]